MRLFAVVLLVLALPAHAQLYKWVDKNGVVNYTDSPPADANVNPTEKLTDRVSSYPVDPVTKAAAAARGPSYYELQLEREWAQRQRLMAAANTQAQPCAGAYSVDCYESDPRYAGYATPVLVAARPLRPLNRPLQRPVRSRPILLR